MIDEVEQETESSLSEYEKLEVVSEMMGSLTPDELADGTEVSVYIAQQKKIDYRLAIGTVETGTTTEYGHTAYCIVPKPT